MNPALGNQTDVAGLFLANSSEALERAMRSCSSSSGAAASMLRVIMDEAKDMASR